MVSSLLGEFNLFYRSPSRYTAGHPCFGDEVGTESVDRVLRRAFNGHDLKGESVIDYLVQRTLVPQFIVDEYDNSAWVFMHCDLHNNNLIIDDEFNLQGYVFPTVALIFQESSTGILPSLFPSKRLAHGPSSFSLHPAWSHLAWMELVCRILPNKSIFLGN